MSLSNNPLYLTGHVIPAKNFGVGLRVSRQVSFQVRAGGEPMASVVIRLDPQCLDNPDAATRHRLPDLMAELSRGVISDDGYDYIGEGPLLILFLKVTEIEPALECVLDVIENVRVLDNDLRQLAVVAVEQEGKYEAVYPAGFVGPFLTR